MNRLKLILTLVFTITYFIIYNFIDFSKEKEINSELNKSINELERNYNITLYYNKTIADMYYYNITRNDKILNILSALKYSTYEEEKTLYRGILYEYLKTSYSSGLSLGLKVLLFVSEDNKAILRMHKPEKYGDDLSDVRYGISFTNRTKLPSYGFEQGKTSHAFRNIYPIYTQAGEFLASVEFSFSSESMQIVLDRVNKIHSHFLVKKDILGIKEWKHNEIPINYMPSIEHSDYLISQLKDNNHVNAEISKKTIDENKAYINEMMNKGENFALYKQEDENLLVISFLAIENIKKDKKAAAYLVSYTLNDEIKDILEYNELIAEISFLLLALILFIIYKQIVYGKELSLKVENKTKELQDLNENLEEKILLETEKNRQKDLQLYESSKNAQMGEMIGNIAHQWRQPLSVITTIASGMKMRLEFNIFDKDEAIKDLESLNNTSQYLSKTIDTFRDYLKDDKVLVDVILQDRIDYALQIVSSSLKDNYIELINEIDYDKPVKIEIIKGELSQVLINIINNAKDALKEKQQQEKWVKINLQKENDKAIITIEDNAGGIKDSIKGKIFDPYFTTKHQSQGTGIGLYMSAQIVEKHFKGKLYVKNTYNGAKFFIELPLES